MKKTILGTVVIVLSLVTVLLFYSFEQGDSRFENKTADYEILQSWELPERLMEVSAIEWIGDQQIAAVQDEEGVIFIFDLKTRKVTEEFKFGEAGDYEGLSITQGTAYVLRSDGTIFQVENYASAEPKVQSIKTTLSGMKGIDVEGLSIDPNKERLLVAVKEYKDDKDSRGIYSLELKDKKMQENPVFSVKFSDKVFSEEKGGKKGFSPSEIEVHPITKDLYILDAKNPRLLILSSDGKARKLYHLKKKEFGQPEGLTFSPDGTMYISNENKERPANILQVKLN